MKNNYYRNKNNRNTQKAASMAAFPVILTYTKEKPQKHCISGAAVYFFLYILE